jgi:hypothetical protein
MEPENSLPYSQVPATCPYPEPAPSSPHNPSHFLKIPLNIILLVTDTFHKVISVILCSPDFFIIDHNPVHS